MKEMCLELLFLGVLLGVSSASKYNEVYVETACRHNSTVVFSLGTSESSAIVIKSKEGDGYEAHNDCNITVSADSIKEGHVMLTVRRIDFDDPDSCHNYIEIFNGSSFMDKICGNFDYTTSIVSFTIPREDFAKFHYHTANSSTSHSGFEIVATAYTEGFCRGNFDFHCSSYICISRSLKCDGYNNCGDRSDEIKCIPPSYGKKSVIVAAIVIMVLLLTALVVLVTWYCLKKRREYIVLPMSNFQPFCNLRTVEGKQSSFPVFDMKF